MDELIELQVFAQAVRIHRTEHRLFPLLLDAARRAHYPHVEHLYVYERAHAASATPNRARRRHLHQYLGTICNHVLYWCRTERQRRKYELLPVIQLK